MNVTSWIGRILLFPFSILYGISVGFRNMLYESGLLRSTSFNIPVISVGNLSVGGAGKTPHVEYLIQLLKENIYVSVLSRGYKRKTKGFRIVDIKDTVIEVGDEPLQYKRKWPDITAAVCESRNIGIPLMLQKHPQIQTILLDDAFQHRGVNPGLNILLTTFDLPYTRDYLLPAGRLREYTGAAERADIIVVSKCPRELSAQKAKALEEEIAPLDRQKLFFSYYDYYTPYFMYNPQIKRKLEDFGKVIVLSAIANEDYLLDYLEPKTDIVHVMKYEDHHNFTEYEVSLLKKAIEDIGEKDCAIITTEKDAMRLDLHRSFIVENKIPIFVLPVKVKFHFDGQSEFDQLTKDFLLNFKS